MSACPKQGVRPPFPSLGPSGSFGAAPIKIRIATGATRIRLLGTPGPDGMQGPPGDKGGQGDPGITILPTDTPINGGFF